MDRSRERGARKDRSFSWMHGTNLIGSDYDLTDGMARTGRALDRSIGRDGRRHERPCYVRTVRIFPCWPPPPQETKQKSRREKSMDRSVSRRSIGLDSLLFWNRSMEPTIDHLSAQAQLDRCLAITFSRHAPVALVFRALDSSQLLVFYRSDTENS
jgi:hypothetical protein